MFKRYSNTRIPLESHFVNEFCEREASKEDDQRYTTTLNKPVLSLRLWDDSTHFARIQVQVY